MPSKTIDGKKSLQVFKNGNLVRLLLRDFMTYKEVVLRAGPNLNLVLGPNGTGKSALVCAIIIGLGGEPATTGRSGHLGEYIRFGCDSALVEIELYNERPNEKNLLIQRVIQSKQNSSGKTEFTSSFKLNGKDKTRTQVRDFIHNLNINVDNLCQFLPQERVVEFVKMDRKTLLECTEKAAGDVLMYDSHQQIVGLAKGIRKLNEMHSDLENQISTDTELQARAEQDLRRIEEKDRFKDEIEWLRRKRPWIEYEAKRVDYMTAKDQLLAKKQQIQELSKSLDPLKAEVTDSRKGLAQSQAKKTEAMNELKKVAKNIEPIKSKIEDQFDKMHESKAYYFEQMEAENKRNAKLRQLESDLEVLRNQFDSVTDGDTSDIDEQIQSVVQEMTAINAETTQHNKNRMKLKEEKEKIMIERNRSVAEMKTMEDVFRRRLDKLRDLNLNAAKAYEWLDRNKNNFKATIHPPIMTQINIKRIEWAKYVESAVSKNDLMAFICEDADDLKLFTDSIKQELNIRINVVLAPKQNEEDFDPDFNPNSYSKFGIFCSVKDMFTAPNKVMAYLCKAAQLHRIPVGDEKTDQMIDSLIKNSSFRRIYTHNNHHSITVSRYDQQKVISSDAVRPSMYLNLTVDETKLEEIKQKISVLEEKSEDIRQKSSEVEQSLTELNTKLEELKRKKKSLDNKKNEKRILETKINEKREQITRGQKQTINLDDIKNKTNGKVQKSEEMLLKLLSDLRKTTTECVNTNDSKLKAELSETLVRKLLQSAERRLREASTQFEDLRNELRTLEEELSQLKTEARQLRDEAKKISGFDVNGGEDFELVREKFDSLPNTIEEIDNQIGTLRLRMNSILDADESVRDSYNQRQKAIEKRQKDLESKKAELEAKQTNLEELKNNWMPALEGLIEKINNNFGTFMARLNCAGEVALYKPDDLESFDEYGISIKVKFRQTEQLRELTSFHQSGGERSVSTMIYMIALQELTSVPFRCVDEINQGMDENNERSVFDLISETSSRNNSQYFLFSPKLLSNLTYTDEMTVHIIFNGPFNEFDWSRVVVSDTSDEDSD